MSHLSRHLASLYLMMFIDVHFCGKPSNNPLQMVGLLMFTMAYHMVLLHPSLSPSLHGRIAPRPRCCASWPKPVGRAMNRPAVQRPRQLHHSTVWGNAPCNVYIWMYVFIVTINYCCEVFIFFLEYNYMASLSFSTYPCGAPCVKCDGQWSGSAGYLRRPGSEILAAWSTWGTCSRLQGWGEAKLGRSRAQSIWRFEMCLIFNHIWDVDPNWLINMFWMGWNDHQPFLNLVVD